MNNAPLDQPAASTKAVDVAAVVQVLAHCTDDDVGDVEQCVEAMTLVIRYTLTLYVSGGLIGGCLQWLKDRKRK